MLGTGTDADGLHYPCSNSWDAETELARPARSTPQLAMCVKDDRRRVRLGERGGGRQSCSEQATRDTMIKRWNLNCQKGNSLGNECEQKEWTVLPGPAVVTTTRCSGRTAVLEEREPALADRSSTWKELVARSVLPAIESWI